MAKTKIVKFMCSIVLAVSLVLSQSYTAMASGSSTITEQQLGVLFDGMPYRCLIPCHNTARVAPPNPAYSASVMPYAATTEPATIIINFIVHFNLLMSFRFSIPFTYHIPTSIQFTLPKFYTVQVPHSKTPQSAYLSPDR